MMALSAAEQMQWRLLHQPQSQDDVVAFVLPYQSQGRHSELMLETRIQTPHHRFCETDIPWSDTDLSLFLSLYQGTGHTLGNHIHLNFSDPTLLYLLHIVASARFVMPTDLSHAPISSEFATVSEPTDLPLGVLISLLTPEGFKLGVLTQLHSWVATCVVLEPFELPTVRKAIRLHDVVSVSRRAVLPAAWGLWEDASMQTLQ